MQQMIIREHEQVDQSHSLPVTLLRDVHLANSPAEKETLSSQMTLYHEEGEN